MEAMDTQVDGRTFSGLDDLFFYLLGHFRNHFLDACRVNTTVLYQLVQRQTRYLAAHGVKSRESDCSRSIIYDNLHTRSSLQRTDISSLTADDTCLDVVILYMENRNGALSSRLRSHTLNGLDDDFLCLFVRLQTGIVHDLVDIRHSRSLCLVLEGLHQLLLRLLSAHSGKLLQLLLCLVVHLLDLLLTVVQSLLALLCGLCFLVRFVETSLDLSLTLVQLLLTLLQTLFLLLYAFVLLTHGIVMLQLEGDKFLLSLNNLVFLHYLRFLGCLLNYSGANDAGNEVVAAGSHQESCNYTNDN